MPTLPFKLNQNRRHHIPKQKHKVTNSAAYDAALRQRGSLTVWFTDEAIAAWKAQATHDARRAALALPSGDPDRADAPGRVSPGAASDGGADRFHHPPARAHSGGPGPHDAQPSGTDAEVPRPRPRKDGEPLHLLVDSTGLKLCDAGEWLIEKHGAKTRRSWRKSHIGLDADTGQIVAAALTAKEVDDGSEVGPLLDQVGASAASFTGDGAYDQEGVPTAVAEPHAAGPPSAQHCRARTSRLAEGVRIHEASPSRGSHRQVQAGDR